MLSAMDFFPPWQMVTTFKAFVNSFLLRILRIKRKNAETNLRNYALEKYGDTNDDSDKYAVL